VDGRRRIVAAFALSAALALAVAACGGGERGGGVRAGGTLVFGASADPVSLDGAKVSDGESIRVIYQIFEGLVRTKDGGFDPEPLLATSWTASADGRSWTFELRRGVPFHDGTAFDADAVCFNFNRWYNFRGLLQSDSVSYYWNTVFGTFSDKPATSLYASCQAQDADTVTINLTKPSASFLSALTLPAFSIASPTALRTYEADRVSGTAEQPRFEGSYDLQHPTGTGPFRFQSFTANDRVVLVRNDDYWGQKAKVDRLIFRTIPDAPARRTALQTGEINLYENPSPDDIAALRQAGFQVAKRPPFNVGYVGFNQKKPPLDNLKIRQAIAHALNREALVKAKYPEGAIVATQFQPPDLFGWNPDVPKYDYNPAKARQLIAESGVTNPTIEFWYPTGVSRGYMPDPAANFQAFKADLEAVGFRVIPRSAPWRPDYLQQVHAGAAQVYLLGWLADFGDPDNFIGVFFQQYSDDWGFTNQQIFSTLDEAERETDPARRTELYKEANKLIMEFLPGVPYVHTSTFVVLAPNVRGFIPSPINLERYSIVGFAG
jgi:peptide/nickel transport system substrate-binding protein